MSYNVAQGQIHSFRCSNTNWVLWVAKCECGVSLVSYQNGSLWQPGYFMTQLPGCDFLIMS